MLKILLEMNSCDVFEACDGLEAIAVAGREQLDLILLDGSLPLLNGPQATRRIREERQLHEIIILALNGWGTPRFYADALAAGCNDCLTKPLDFALLEKHMTPLYTRAATQT